MTWFKGIQMLAGIVTLPVALAVVFHRSVASPIATPSDDRQLPPPSADSPAADQRSSDFISHQTDDAANGVTPPLRMRIVQLVVLCSAVTSFGVYVPFLLLVIAKQIADSLTK
jgi:hypothetical protein